MGKKHRENRTKIKREALRLGYREDELGELKASKAYRRRRFVVSASLRDSLRRPLEIDMAAAEAEIMAVASARAVEDIQASLDAQVMREILDYKPLTAFDHLG